MAERTAALDHAPEVAESVDVAAPVGRVSPRRRARGPIALEREADRTVDAILAGAVGLARSLTPTTPGAITLPTSAGRPLPRAARRRLETALGADLGAVRVHTDAPARSYVAADGAHALAAGPDVFFAPGHYDPSSSDGFRLLAHEVVHTLQQTGRRTHGSRLAATARRGSGPVQAEDPFLDRFTPGGGIPDATPTDQFDQVTADHGGSATGSAIESFHATLSSRLGGRIDPSDPRFEALVTDVLAGSHGASSVQERSFLLDVLKVAQAWNAAATLIEQSDELLMTAGRSPTFEAWLSTNRRRDWPAGAVAGTPQLDRYRDLSLGAFRIFLVRPDQRPYVLSQAEANRMVDRPAWTTTLQVNERIWMAAELLDGIEQLRYQMCREVDSASGLDAVSDDADLLEFLGNPIFRGGRRAQYVRRPLDAWVQMATAEGEPLQLAAVRWFLQRQEVAAEFWATAIQRWSVEIERRNLAGRFDISDELRAELRRELDANPVAAAAVAAVAAAGIEFLRADETDVPAAAGYTALVAAFDRVLTAQVTRLTRDLSEFRLDAATRARADLVPWLLFRLTILAQSVRAYDATRDTGAFDDTRQGHRLRVATDLRKLAVEIGDSALELDALAVQQNVVAGHSRLLLISDWERPARSDPRDLVKDFEEGIRFSDHIVLASEAVASFYDEAYLSRLADALELGLDPAVEADMRDRLVLHEAAATARDAPQAVRWFVRDADWEPNPYETRTIEQLIEFHPKSEAQLPAADADTRVAYPGRGVVGSLADAPHFGEVFAWELPAWDELALQMATALHEIEFLADRIGPVVDPMTWLFHADELIGAADGPTVAAARLRIWAHLYDREKLQRRRLGTHNLPPGLLRQATTHDRGVIARRATTMLAGYDGRVGTWQVPTDVLDLIEQFHRYAAPPRDNLAQTVALLVEIAPALRQAFVRESFWGQVVVEEDRYDVVTGYYGFLLVAVARLNDVAGRREVRDEFLGLDDVTLELRRADLAEVKAAFDRVRRRVQLDSGFEVTAGGGLRSLNYPFVIDAEQIFGWNGSRVQVSRVFHRFRYHPRYGRRSGEIEGIPQGAYSAALILDASTEQTVPAGTELIEIRINENPVIIRAPAHDDSAESDRNLELLEFLWRAVEDQAFVLSMQNLQDAFDEMLTLGLDLAEFIPGAGQAIAIGRVVVTVAAFLASADFEDIKAMLSGEIIEQVQGVIEEITALLTPDQLWVFLLFDLDLSLLDRLRGRNARDTARARRVRRHGGRFGRIMRGLLRIGSMIGHQVELLHERIQPPLRGAQSFVVRHPIVAYLVDRAADAVAMGPELLDAIEDVRDFADLENGLSARIEELVGGLEGFELPEEIIPLDLVISAILSLILERFGRKGKIISFALNATGAMAEISAMVAEALRDTEADPNVLWLEEVRPLVDGVLDSARRDFIDGIYGALELAGADVNVRPVHQPVETTPNPDAVEEAGALPALAPGFRLDDVLPTMRVSAGDVIPPGPGSPLPARSRIAAERALGRGFGHVRLHRSTIGEGVDGLARGSHVVVRPGLSLDAGRGAAVLRHELAHVAQQTRAGSSRPTRGRAGTTVRFDPAAERAAELAGRTGAGTSIAAGNFDAAAPALSPEVLSRVLRRMASYADLRAFQRDIHDTVTTLPSLDAEQTRLMGRFKDKLVEALRFASLPVSGIPTSTHAPYNIDQLVRHHASLAGGKIRDLAAGAHDGVERLGRRALREQSASRTRAAGGVAARTYKLIHSDLRRLTEGYLLVRTGLLCDIRLPRSDAAFETLMNGSTRLDLSVTGLFMGAVTRNSRLWEPILEPGGQLAVGRTVHGAGIGAGRNRYEITDAAKQTDLYQTLVSRMRAFGMRRKVLDFRTFTIRGALVAEAVDSLALGTDVPAEQLPRPTGYLETTLGSPLGRLTSGHQIALRIATHGELTAAATLDRDSHHTTQYLFAEYFTHRVAQRPFLADEPGLQLATGRPEILHRADGGQAIQFGDLHGPENGRGAPMPAILIARPVHQQAGLHVGRSRPDESDDAGGGSSQGSTVHSWFRSKAPASRLAEEEAPAGSVPSAVASLAAPAKRRNRQLVDGVEEVYTRMRRMMLGALEAGLITHEKPYYETIAARVAANRDEGDLKDEWLLDEAALRRVFVLARENNDDIMREKFGVRVPS